DRDRRAQWRRRHVARRPLVYFPPACAIAGRPNLAVPARRRLCMRRFAASGARASVDVVDGGAREEARGKAGRAEGGHDLAAMRAVARLDDGIDLGELHRHVVKQSLMMDLDDIAALLADNAGDLGERAGDVADLDAQADKAPGADQFALQDRGEEAGIDIAAGEDEPDAAAAEALGVIEKGRERRRAGAFDDDALAIEQQCDG